MNQPKPAKHSETSPTLGPSASFEQLVSRLEHIARRLESTEVPLEEALALFEEGMALSKQSGERLDAAERRLEMLLEKGNIGALPSDVLVQSSSPGNPSSGSPGSRRE